MSRSTCIADRRQTRERLRSVDERETSLKGGRRRNTKKVLVTIKNLHRRLGWDCSSSLLLFVFGAADTEVRTAAPAEEEISHPFS